ncbi:MAG: hypothetical protein HYY16_01095 [Planctomycetes bacterium]|nr:hypothetical protein [Planctomycetota bacterium]
MPNSQCPKCRLVMQPNKDRFEVPEKVQVEFLLAEFDTFKARQPDPSEEDIKKYYESNKTHFEKPGAASETETKEYKPIEEVKGEIIDKIKGSKARTQAYDEIRKIDLEIGRLLDAKRKALREEVKKELEARPKEEQATLDRLVEERLLEAGATWFFDLQKRFQAQGVELRNDITTAFDRNHLDEAFKFLGKPAKADGERRFKDTWAFTAKAGEIDKAVMETDKGWCVSRLARKIPAYVPDLIEPIRDRIRRELQQKDAIDRAEKLAKTVQDDLKKKTAVSVVARKYGLVFQHSDYFGRRAAMGDQPNLGMSDFALANKVRAKTFPSANPLEAGEVFSIDGSEIGADKKLWRYVVQVEDVVQVPSDSLETDFERQRKEVEQAKLAEHRRERINDIMMLASLEEAKNKPEGGN